MIRTPLVALLAFAVLAVGLAACGGDSGGSGGSGKTDAEGRAAAETRKRLNGADRPNAADFPKPQGGQSLQAFADSLGASPGQAALASSVFTPGPNRVAFGVLDEQNTFAYGPSALYVARRPGSTKVLGPFPAPADVLITEPGFRSKQAATEDDPFAAVYEARDVQLPSAGSWVTLTVTRANGGYVAASTQLRVAKRSPVPQPGDKAPVVDTETVEDDPSLKKIDTRDPPARELHEENFKDVVGRKPVALLFATPQLCQSRVCGPVVDIALQLRERYGDKVTFIHQEVYNGNKVDKGLRPPLARFGVPTEPWLFTVKSDGTVAAALEGSFGLRAFDRAVQAAL
jgi:hypothetical protein